MPDYLRIQVDAIYAKYFETFNDEIRYYRQMQEIDDQVPVLYYNIGGLYDMLFQYDQAIPELEKGLNIYEKWDVKPAWAGCYTNLGYAYHKTGQFKKEKELYKKAEKDFPDDQYLKYLQVVLSLTEGDSIAAKNYLDKYISICKSRSFYESDISTELAKIYTEAGILDKAEQYYRKAISSIELTSNNSWYFNNLAVFLIDNDRNIEEGIILADKILKLSPYDYNFLETKGWALYKGGKYNEALDILQKSWDLRLKNAVYDHRAFLHLEAAKRQSEI
jgi:tetratricopeptide (TPR) repeat protein